MRNLISPQERCFSRLDVETIDQLLTLEVLCPRDARRRFRHYLENVLGESLQHHGIKRNVPFTNRTGSTMNVNFEVTDTKRAILSVHKGSGFGSMIVFIPDGKGKIVKDTKCIAPTAATLCVGGPHRGRRRTESHSASPSTLRHSHLWGGRNPRVLRWSTSDLDDPCDGGGQHGRSGADLPWASSGWWVVLPWRLGTVHQSLAHRLPGGIQAQSLLWKSAIYLRPTRRALDGAWRLVR